MSVNAGAQRDQPDVMLSVVMPAHNEQKYLAPAVRTVVAGLRARSAPFEVLICENGSVDGTAGLAACLADSHDEVRALTLSRPDYGGALRAGFLAGRGELVVNFDVDFVDLDFLDNAMALMEPDGSAAGVIASKRSPGARDTRPARRRLATAAFSVLLRHGFGLRVSDTHGIKVLRRSQLGPIVDACRFGADLFDSELILRAERAGFTIAELPVTVRETRPPRTSLARRIPRTLVGLVRLRLVLWREARP